MTVRPAAIEREIKDEHEGSFHELSGCDLDACVAVVYPETSEELLIGQRTSLCIGRVQRQDFGGYLAPIHIHHKVVEAEMHKEKGVSLRRFCEIHVSKHREEQMFWQDSQHRNVYGHGFQACPESEYFNDTLVMSYRAFTFSRALACANGMVGDGFTCFTCSVASKNL